MSLALEPRLAGVQTHLLRSSRLQAVYRIWVASPFAPLDDAEPLPVLYATDANLTFDVLKGLAWSLQDQGRGVAPFLLVGLGYPGEGPAAGQLLRMRDMAFPGYPSFSLAPPQTAAGVLTAEPGAPDYGCADDFLDFLGAEVFPFVEATYGAASAERAYFGHSLGAGFGVYAMIERPTLFSRLLLSSPGVGYHGVTSAGVRYSDYDFLLDRVAAWLASGPALPGRRVHLTVGSEEGGEAAYANWRLTRGVQLLAQQLEDARTLGLEVSTEVLAGETHASAWPISFMHGVRAMFGRRAEV